MKRFATYTLAGTLALSLAPAANACPCGFAASVRARELRNYQMGCGFSESLVSKFAVFSAVKIKKNGSLAKRYDFSVSQAAGNPDDASCRIQVTRGGGGGKTVSDTLVNTDAAGAASCVADLSAFALGQRTQGTDDELSPCEDVDGNSFVDAFEDF